jgi:translation initiation factor IF-1
MVKNTTGGSKHKRQKNSIQKLTRPLILKEDANEGYGQISTFLGGNMVMVRKLGSQIEFRCRMRKSLSKIKKKDIILYALREYESKDIGDILLVYTIDEVNVLKKNKYIEDDKEVDELFTYGDDDEEDNNEDNEESNNIKEEKEININNI